MKGPSIYIFYAIFILASLFHPAWAFAQCSGCTTTITTSTSSGQSLNGSNQKICITGGTFSGTININGTNNSVCIGTGATFTGNINMNSSTSIVDNHGTWNSSNFTVNNGTFSNFGSMTTDNLTTNSNGILLDFGSSFTVNGNLVNNGSMNFSSSVTINGNLTVNSSNGVVFQSGAAVSGNVVANDSLSFLGNTNVSGNLVVNGSGVLRVDGGIVTVDGNFDHFGTSTGSSSDCGGITVSGNSNNTGNFATDGTTLDICGNSGGGFDTQTGSIGPSVSNCNCSPSGPLPIELLHFSAKLENDGVLLEWATAAEMDNDYFTIERSSDGVHYEVVATLPGAGYSNKVLRYRHYDKIQVESTLYYRLRQTDFNGAFSLSPMQAVSPENAFASQANMRFWPQPNAGKELHLRCQSYSSPSFSTVRVLNVWGQEVGSWPLAGDAIETLTFPISLPPGQYILQLQSGTVLDNQVLLVQ